MAVPLAWLVGWQEWAGPLTAVVLAISGRASNWWSEGYRGDAEWTIRTIELNRGIGYEVDAAQLAELRSKYFRALQRHRGRGGHAHYYEASGDSSNALLIKMVRESAWWTAQLAKKASKCVLAASGLVVLASILTIALGVLEADGEAVASFWSEVFRRGYGLAIFAVVLLDTLNLSMKYHRLGVAAGESMKQLTALLDRVDDICAARVLSAVFDYQSARREGPLIPDWFKRRHEVLLQTVWDETFSVK